MPSNTGAANETVIRDTSIDPTALCFNCQRELVGVYRYSYTYEENGQSYTYQSPRGLCDSEFGQDLIGVVARGILPAITFNEAIYNTQQALRDAE